MPALLLTRTAAMATPPLPFLPCELYGGQMCGGEGKLKAMYERDRESLRSSIYGMDRRTR